MCELCEENEGNYEHCQDCGRLICYDAPRDSVDVLDCAYVTESGDLYCDRCGRGHDEDDEYDADLDFGFEFDPYEAVEANHAA